MTKIKNLIQSNGIGSHMEGQVQYIERLSLAALLLSLTHGCHAECREADTSDSYKTIGIQLSGVCHTSHELCEGRLISGQV